MAMLCDFCGKGIMYGNKVSHAKNRSKRTFRPNLHKKKIIVEGRSIRAKLCTKCIKLAAKAKKEESEVSQESPSTTV